MAKIIFDTITERDIDIMMIEEFVSSNTFCALFLDKIKLSNVKLESIEHSKMNAVYGESDLTLIFAGNNKKYGLLIENKIDAIAMPNQCARYFRRGEIGQEEGYYDVFYVFIVAPKEYLATNEEAKKYPYSVTYEEMVSIFESEDEVHSKFKVIQLNAAINKQKDKYRQIEVKSVTDFWTGLFDYQEMYYPNLQSKNKKGKKGRNSSWPQYESFCKHKLFYKTKDGVVDLQMKILPERDIELREYIKKYNPNYSEEGFEIIRKRGAKSVFVRLHVPRTDINKPFVEQIENIDLALRAVEKMNRLCTELNLKDFTV